MLQNRGTFAAKNTDFYIYMSIIYTHAHTLIYICVCLRFCHREVFVHTWQFLSCSLLKVILLLRFSPVFCSRKRSLIFEAHRMLYQAESLPDSSLIPLWLCPDWGASAQAGGAGQQAGVGKAH